MLASILYPSERNKRQGGAPLSDHEFQKQILPSFVVVMEYKYEDEGRTEIFGKGEYTVDVSRRVVCPVQHSSV